MTNDTDISGGSEHKDLLKSIIDYCIERFIYIYLQQECIPVGCVPPAH